MRRETLPLLGLLLSLVLLVAKAWAGVTSGSMAVVSDALNSVLDVFSYGAITLSVRVQNRRPDATHPFGYHRAEPLAGFLVAVMAVVFGVSVVKDALGQGHSHVVAAPNAAVLVVLALSVASKGVLWGVYRRAARSWRSHALAAASTDSRNDVLASLTALAGFSLRGSWDSAAACAIGLWILYSGIRMGVENSGYLLGSSPGPEFVEDIRRHALSVEGVAGVNDIRAHYVGSLVHLEVHIEVPREMTVLRSHAIGEEATLALEALTDVGTVFVHIDVTGDSVRLPLG